MSITHIAARHYGDLATLPKGCGVCVCDYNMLGEDGRQIPGVTLKDDFE
jgi:hypothetical protein